MKIDYEDRWMDDLKCPFCGEEVTFEMLADDRTCEHFLCNYGLGQIQSSSFEFLEAVFEIYGFPNDTDPYDLIFNQSTIETPLGIINAEEMVKEVFNIIQKQGVNVKAFKVATANDTGWMIFEDGLNVQEMALEKSQRVKNLENTLPFIKQTLYEYCANWDEISKTERREELLNTFNWWLKSYSYVLLSRHTHQQLKQLVILESKLKTHLSIDQKLFKPWKTKNSDSPPEELAVLLAMIELSEKGLKD